MQASRPGGAAGAPEQPPLRRSPQGSSCRRSRPPISPQTRLPSMWSAQPGLQVLPVRNFARVHLSASWCMCRLQGLRPRCQSSTQRREWQQAIRPASCGGQPLEAPLRAPSSATGASKCMGHVPPGMAWYNLLPDWQARSCCCCAAAAASGAALPCMRRAAAAAGGGRGTAGQAVLWREDALARIWSALSTLDGFLQRPRALPQQHASAA